MTAGVLLAALLLGGGSATSLTSPAPLAVPAQEDSLRVYLLTFGPGAEVWERFGHNAIWIHDPEAGTDIAYHYGLFDMSESGFLTRFLQGRMFYYMGDASAPLLVQAYRRVGRSATVQELRIAPDRVRELQAFLRWNLLPENRGYRYHYFRDNCSTRVRDALDRALGGALAAALRGRPARITYRQEALSLTAEDELLTTGMDLGLGPLGDQPITRWELGFIPMRLRDDVRDVTVEQDGRTLPLVASEHELRAIGTAEAAPAVPADRVTARGRWMLLLGLAVGGAFAMLGWLAGRRAGGRGPRDVARALLAAGGAAWGLLTGILGLVLLGLWTLTDHEFAHTNENLLQANPLALALVVLVPLAVVRGGSRAARVAALTLAALAVLGLLLHPLPLTRQSNLGIIALALPIHLGVLFALWRLDEGEVSPADGA